VRIRAMNSRWRDDGRDLTIGGFTFYLRGNGGKQQKMSPFERPTKDVQ